MNLRERLEAIADSDSAYHMDHTEVPHAHEHAVDEAILALDELNACKRAWREVGGVKTWYRLVPDPNPEARDE